MRKITRYLLWAFLFTVPWDNFPLPVVGSVSRVFGLALAGMAILTAAVQGRLKRPGAVLGFAIAYGVWGTLSLLWTVSDGNTTVRVATVAQFVISMWVMREFVRNRKQVEPLLAAVCFGLFVPLVDLLNNFRLGNNVNAFDGRFSGNGLNADLVGLYLVLGLPIAWHLVMNRRHIVRVAGVIYFVAAPVGLLLTGTRGAFVAGLAACTIVPFTLPRLTLRGYALGAVLLTGITVAAALVVPRANWDRIMTISTQVTGGGSMSGRTDIWRASWQVFLQHPVVGVGYGGFAPATEPYLHNRFMSNAHNLVLGLLVEGGVVGLVLFASMIGACVWTAFRSPPPYRALWSVLLLTWLVGGLSGSPETVKFTWVLFGFIAAEAGLPRTSSDVVPSRQPARVASRSLRTVPV
jgi:O-antigen ligase